MKILALIFAMALVAGCGKVCVKPKFDPPPRPTLPTITEAELQCLSDATFSLLLQREQMRRNYAEDLEAIAKECSK